MPTTSNRDHKTFAERVKSLRGYLTLTRKEFCRKHGIPEPSLRAWELGLYTITPPHLKKIIRAFEAENILCTAEWLLNGTGTPPLFALETLHHELKKVEEEIATAFSFSNPVLTEAAVFQHYNPNSLVVQMKDNAMLPLYDIGDSVGGIQIKLPIPIHCHGKPHIFSLEDGTQLVRTLYQGSTENTFTLGCLNLLNQMKSPTLTDVFVQDIYRVVWHRKTA